MIRKQRIFRDCPMSKKRIRYRGKACNNQMNEQQCGVQRTPTFDVKRTQKKSFLLHSSSNTNPLFYVAPTKCSYIVVLNIEKTYSFCVFRLRIRIPMNIRILEYQEYTPFRRLRFVNKELQDSLSLIALNFYFRPMTTHLFLLVIVRQNIQNTSNENQMNM